MRASGVRVRAAPPPCDSATRRTSARPSPDPGVPLEPSPRTNSSNRSASARGPSPSSSTAISTAPLARVAATVIAGPPWRAALTTRLRTAAVNAAGSASTSGTSAATWTSTAALRPPEARGLALSPERSRREPTPAPAMAPARPRRPARGPIRRSRRGVGFRRARARRSAAQPLASRSRRPRGSRAAAPMTARGVRSSCETPATKAIWLRARRRCANADAHEECHGAAEHEETASARSLWRHRRSETAAPIEPVWC